MSYVFKIKAEANFDDISQARLEVIQSEYPKNKIVQEFVYMFGNKRNTFVPVTLDEWTAKIEVDDIEDTKDVVKKEITEAMAEFLSEYKITGVNNLAPIVASHLNYMVPSATVKKVTTLRVNQAMTVRFAEGARILPFNIVLDDKITEFGSQPGNE